MSEAPKPLWASPNSDNTEQSEIHPHLFQYQELLIEGGSYDGEAKVLAKSISDGKERWRWNSWARRRHRVFFIPSKTVPIMGNIGVFLNRNVATGDHTMYGINLDRGQTVWSHQYDYSYAGDIDYNVGYHLGDGIGSGESYYYYMKKNDDRDKSFHLIKGDPATGRETTLLSFIPPPSQEETKLYRNAGCPYVWKDPETGETLLTVGFAELSSKGFVPHLALVNLSNKQIVYIKSVIIPDESNFRGYPPQVVGNKILFLLDRSLVAAEVKTGKILWVHPIPRGGFGATGFGVGGGKVFVNPQNTILYGLDLEKGRGWQKDYGTGSVANIAYKNGLIYFVGGSLYVVNAKTGDLVLKLLSPDQGKYFAGVFTGKVVIIEDKLYVRSYYNLYCYPLSDFERRAAASLMPDKERYFALE